MSDFPEKAPDKTNAAAVMVIGLATTAVLWAFVVYLQSYFENTQGEIAATRAAIGRSSEVRDLKAEQRADMTKTTYADAAKGTLKRLDIEQAKMLVVRDAKSGTSLIPSLGELNVPTVPAAAGRPADDATVEPAAPAPTEGAASADDASSDAAATGDATATGDAAAVPPTEAVATPPETPTQP